MRAFDLTLYLVTDPGLCGARGVPETVRAAVAGGVTLVQLRDPSASTRSLVQTATALQEVLRGTGVPLLVNDRVDVALAVGADGVHLGQSDLDPLTARRLLGPDALLGLSVSYPDELAVAAALPDGTLDYLGIGPYVPTPTKPKAAAPLGFDGTVALAAASPFPCVAIGGVGPGTVDEIRRTGVAGVAVVSAVCAAPDPTAAARALLP